MHPGNHRPVTEEYFHLVIASLYLLLLRYMGLLTKGTLLTMYFSCTKHSVYSAGCLEHLGSLYESLCYGKGLRIWKKGQPKQRSGATLTQAIQQQTLGMLGLLRSCLFLHYWHQILNCRKPRKSSEITSLNFLLEFGAFALLFLSLQHRMSPCSLLTHQLQDDSPC